MQLTIPAFSMVAVIGTTGSGKSTFCRKHFLDTEVLSSDAFRGLVADDEDSQDATKDAFEALHYMLGVRLRRGKLTVVDATNVQKESRAPLLKLANQYHALKVAIVLDVPESICLERNRERANRQFGPHVIRNQRRDLMRTIGQLKSERWHRIYVLKPDQIDAAEIVREPLFNQRQDEHGPFDIIGDVHGCLAELQELLQKLGWNSEADLHHPDGRKLVFVGDLVDRGPDSVGVLKFVMHAVETGAAICVPGNHDIKLLRALNGKQVSLAHGLKETLEQLEPEPGEFKGQVRNFLDNLVSHYMFDDNRLCVAHAGMREDMQGRGSGAVREFALYGETTGETDEFGLPIRYEWAREYRGKALVVYGHTPVPQPEWINNTIDIDTGCCFGGALTALRYPERELVSVSAHQVYAEPIRPLQTKASLAVESDILEIQDVLGRRGIDTRLGGRVTIREENAIAALEVMSRFVADPHWIVYLPPTMSPCATSERDGYLEYPTEALGYYASHGVQKVVCQEKHMGSRAVAVICRNSDTAAKRFRVDTGEQGIITTRTGRRFFDDASVEVALVERIHQAAEKSGLYEELKSDWLVLDMELMPWSAKAVGLLRDQYAPVGTAASSAAAAWKEITSSVAARGVEGAEDLARVADRRLLSAAKFTDAYRRYCWQVSRLEDYKLAPFHLLASEGAVHVDKHHGWHVEMLGRLCEEDSEILKRTNHLIVDLNSEQERQEACAWWEKLVDAGGEGMVVKPWDFLVLDKGRPLQPAVKCRGPEYLRIIYGPEYLEPENLAQLRRRSVNRKRGLASREFVLGIEALERFVGYKSLTSVHECVFGVLALESEPVDPRL